MTTYFVERVPSNVRAGVLNRAITIFCGLSLIAAVLIGFNQSPIQWPVAFVFAVLYGALLLFSARFKEGVYLNVSIVAVLGALLNQGYNAVWIVAIGGALLSETGRALLYQRLNLQQHTLRQAIKVVCLEAGVTVFAVSVGGMLFARLGGTLPANPKEITLSLAALFGLVFILHQVPITATLIFVYPTLKRPAWIRPYLRAAALELVALPFSALLAVISHDLSLPVFTTAVMTGAGGLLLLKMTEAAYQMTRQRVRELAILNAFSQSLSADLSLDELLSNLHEQIERLVKVEMFVITLHDPTTGMLHIPYVSLYGERLHWPSTQPSKTVNQYLIKTRTPLLLQGDVVAKGRTLGFELPFPPFPVCLLSTPLIAADEVVAVMSIESFSDVNAYGADDVALMQMLAPQAAVALKNAQLYERTASMANELAQLNEVSAVVSATLDLNVIMASICQTLERLNHADKTALFLYQQNRTVMTIGYSTGFSDDYAAQFVNFPIGQFSERTDVLAISDLSTSPQAIGWRTLAEVGGYQALALAPLRVNEQAIGLLGAFYGDTHVFGDAEVNRLRMLANQVAVAVSNAQLYQEARQRTNEMTQLVETIQALVESLELNTVGATLVTHMGQALGLDEASLLLWDTDDAQLQSVASLHHSSEQYTPLADRLFQRAAHEKKPLMLPSVVEDWDILKPLGLETGLLLPVILRSGMAGVILLGSAQARMLTEREQQLAGAMLNQAATALDNARLFHLIDTELDERIRQLSAIDAVSRKMSASLDLETMIHELLNAALSVTYADSAACGLQDAAGRVTFTARIRFAPDISNTISIWQGITGRVIRTGQHVLCGDVSRDPDYFEVVPGTRSELCVPILRNGTPWGVLNLESKNPDAFTPSHLSFVTTLADHAAIAIEKAHLFADIRRGNEQMNTILNSTRDGMILVGQRGNLIRANRAAERLLNRPLQLFIGHNMIRLIARLNHEPVRDIDYPYEAFKEILHALEADPGRVTRQVYQVITENGARDIEEIGLPVQGDDSHSSARLYVLRDISEETSLQRFRDQVTNMIVHDLRSPLSGIIGSLRLLEDLAEEGDLDNFNKVLNIASSNADNLLYLVESILEIRRMENGLMSLEQETVSLSKPAIKAIQSLEVLAEEASIQVENCIPNDLPPVFIDTDKVRRVLTNLIDNALKYTPAEGKIRIEAHYLADESMITVRVVDTGKGIPPEYRERVFGVFVTVPGSALRGRRGTGLGLTFCRLTVEAHGGKIWVESGSEGGAAMCFTLPIATGSPAET